MTIVNFVIKAVAAPIKDPRPTDPMKMVKKLRMVNIKALESKCSIFNDLLRNNKTIILSIIIA